MPKKRTPNPTTHRQLVLTHQLYNEGSELVGQHHTGMARLLGVVVLDLAVETCLKAVVSAVGTSQRPAPNSMLF